MDKRREDQANLNIGAGRNDLRTFIGVFVCKSCLYISYIHCPSTICWGNKKQKAAAKKKEKIGKEGSTNQKRFIGMFCSA